MAASATGGTAKTSGACSGARLRCAAWSIAVTSAVNDLGSAAAVRLGKRLNDEAGNVPDMHRQIAVASLSEQRAGDFTNGSGCDRCSVMTMTPKVLTPVLEMVN